MKKTHHIVCKYYGCHPDKPEQTLNFQTILPIYQTREFYSQKIQDPLSKLHIIAFMELMTANNLKISVDKFFEKGYKNNIQYEIIFCEECTSRGYKLHDQTDDEALGVATFCSNGKLIIDKL